MSEAERDAERGRQADERRALLAVHERDADRPLRVLVLAERLPVRALASVRMVSALAARTSQLQVTVGVTDAEDAEAAALMAAGVEVVADPDPGWIGRRAAHPTVVVLAGAEVAGRLGEMVRRHQPQAAIVYDPTGEAPEDHLVGRTAEAAAIAAAHVVLSPSAAHARFVHEIAPGAQVVVATPGAPELDRALAQALALCGVAVPDAAFG